MNIPSIITIDGPAASGKSTLGKKIADELGYLFFDTGVMYRAVTWIAIQRRVPVDEEAAITALAEELAIDVRPATASDGRACDVWADDQDVTWEIRRPEVESYVSIVSAYPGVRRALSAQQRRIGLRGQVVMVGRDIGTVILPEADLKIYLDASVEERARRRYVELGERAQPADLEEIAASMRMRDQIDSTRETSPLRPAGDAIMINSDEMSVEQVFDSIKELVGGSSGSP